MQADAEKNNTEFATLVSGLQAVKTPGSYIDFLPSAAVSLGLTGPL